MYFKPGMSNPLPSTDKIATKRSDQTQDLTGVSIRHLAWILTDSSFIQESDLAMSSSGKWRQTKNTELKTSHHRHRNNHDAQAHNKFTHMSMDSTDMKPFLPRADPSRIQLTSTMQASRPLSRSASLLSFLQRKRIQSDHSEHVQTRVNLELASG